jgi:hypothetical protein
VLCALIVTVDVAFVHRQRMAVMNLVWPVTMLWSGPIGLAVYYLSFRDRRRSHDISPGAVALATTHCGSGCTLGDLVAESLTAAFPLSLFGSATIATWLLDFVFAFFFGILFQYFSIAPMRHLSLRDGLLAALKADALSLVAWQIGMYGWMALTLFVFYAPMGLGKSNPVFWLMMQVAMFVGFATSYPVNALLLKMGIKETM